MRLFQTMELHDFRIDSKELEELIGQYEKKDAPSSLCGLIKNFKEIIQNRTLVSRAFLCERIQSFFQETQKTETIDAHKALLASLLEFLSKLFLQENAAETIPIASSSEMSEQSDFEELVKLLVNFPSVCKERFLDKIFNYDNPNALARVIGILLDEFKLPTRAVKFEKGKIEVCIDSNYYNFDAENIVILNNILKCLEKSGILFFGILYPLLVEFKNNSMWLKIINDALNAMLNELKLFDGSDDLFKNQFRHNFNYFCSPPSDAYSHSKGYLLNFFVIADYLNKLKQLSFRNLDFIFQTTSTIAEHCCYRYDPHVVDAKLYKRLRDSFIENLVLLFHREVLNEENLTKAIQWALNIVLWNNVTFQETKLFAWVFEESYLKIWCTKEYFNSFIAKNWQELLAWHEENPVDAQPTAPTMGR